MKYFFALLKFMLLADSVLANCDLTQVKTELRRLKKVQADSREELEILKSKTKLNFREIQRLKKENDFFRHKFQFQEAVILPATASLTETTKELMNQKRFKRNVGTTKSFNAMELGLSAVKAEVEGIKLLEEK